MELFNSLSKKIEKFEPINPGLVSMYTCGPTVYDFAQIGNYRTYTTSDLFVRALKFLGYKVNFVMNLTDVGHLTGDNEGDADIGGDRLENSAQKQGKSAREIADFYISDFMQSYEKLKLTRPQKFTRATDYISQQIALVKELETGGFTYVISDGVYFDTSKFKKYGALSGMTTESILEGARVEPNPEKRNPMDFALWKFSPKDSKRYQEWESPWGVGFPGWHLECSAMIMTELGDSIDIHIGGEDLRMIHHQNEIAQSECATGKQFVRYWIHGAFLTVDGGRMGKSLGNAYTLSDIESRGFDPLSLRYFYLSAHYRATLNFTFEALTSAQNALKKLYDLVGGYKIDKDPKPSEKFMGRFREKIEDDLNMPEALAVMWEMLKSSMTESAKLATILKMDEVLGLGVEEHIGYIVPQGILDLARTRMEYRKAGIWDKADVIRRDLLSRGYIIEDNVNGNYKVKKKIF